MSNRANLACYKTLGGKFMLHASPFLLFDGNCAEAMSFYQNCFGGDLQLTKLSDTPMKASLPESLHSRIAYAHLKSNAVEFSATDWMHATRKFNPGNTVAIYLIGGVQELRLIFGHLSAGADPKLLDELKEMPFGVYGHLADKYGVHWFFNGQN